MTAYVIGIDVGTSGTRVLLVEATSGDVVAAHTAEYPLSTPKPQWSEQDPEHWWEATRAGIAAVLASSDVAAEAVAAVGLSGQMHGLVLVDDAGAVLRPAILWNDQRTAAECERIYDAIEKDAVIAITGKPMVTGFTAPKILWVREHEPEVYARVEVMLLPKDFVRLRLTGGCSIDVADASGTSLVDLRSRNWSQAMIDALDIDTKWLPPIAESCVVTALVSAAGAAATGLREGTPVVAGAGDQAAAALGTGVTGPGPVSVSLGTSGVVFAASHEPRYDPTGSLHAFAHAVPNTWHLMGVMLSAGGSLRWFRDLWPDAPSYDALLEMADDVAPGAEGLTFLPYLTGERTPHDDPNAQGAFVGLTLRHGRAHLARAVVEGITFGLRDGLELAKALGLPVDRVRFTGGGAGSPRWRQLAADVFGVDVVTVNVTEGAAYGAAMLAAVGAGVHPSVPDAAQTMVRETGVTTPGPHAGDHAAAYARYRSLYPALAPTWRGV